jgi:DNA-binding NtrC family response regulator
MSKSVLVVDDNASWRDLCMEIVRTLRLETHLADSGRSALDILEHHTVDIVLADVRGPGLSGIELLKTIKQKYPETDVVMMADSGTIPEALEAIRAGAYDYISNISKPFKADDLKHLFQRLLEKRDLAAENRFLRDQLASRHGFGSIVGTSDAMQKIYRLIFKVARRRQPVLILGESGTGKELVARAIHDFSPWQAEPFVPVDCGALPPTLIESELFGHVKGAFTGAHRNRVGLLASAGRGTVFLDEIGEIPLEVQVKLLRALQQHEVKAIGSNISTGLEARILAATNRDLEAGVRKGTFRQDLFYRLNVVSVHVPPLRERKSDIPALVRYFIERYGEDGGITGISYEALSCLTHYDWPGNVRELENCIQHAIALGAGSLIQVRDIPTRIAKPTNQPGDLTSKPNERPPEVTPLQKLERQAIVNALAETGGDRIRAAKLLGIGKTTIYRKVKEYRIEDIIDGKRGVDRTLASSDVI